MLGVGTNRLGNQVIELEGVSKRFGDVTVLRDVDVLIEPGARLGVVGPNGSGKSTLLDIVAGRAAPSGGTLRRGSTVVTGYADQHSSTLEPDAIVRELVAGPYREPDYEDRALLERFWFDSTAQFAPVRMLSGGERRRLQLVMVLAAKPNLLVLDEPTNDLDLDTLRAVEEFLDGWPGALVVASHDRAFLDRTVDHVLAIDDDGRVSRGAGRSDWLVGVASQGIRCDTTVDPFDPSRRRRGRPIRDGYEHDDTGAEPVHHRPPPSRRRTRDDAGAAPARPPHRAVVDDTRPRRARTRRLRARRRAGRPRSHRTPLARTGGGAVQLSISTVSG